MSIIKEHIENSKKFGIEVKRTRNRHTGPGFTIRELQILENSVKRFRKLKLKPRISFENSQDLEEIIQKINEFIMKNLD